MWRQIEDTNYYIDINGIIKKVYKNKNQKILRTYRKGSIQIIKINGKQRNVARLVVESFYRKLKKDEVVVHVNGIILDNRLENLKIMKKKEAGKITGALAKQKTILLMENGEIKQIFKGTREAEKKLFISRQTVSDYCNDKVKHKMYDLIWAEKLV
nr:MAG TPA: HNH endonuclease [Caudoviricetes sp.]